MKCNKKQLTTIDKMIQKLEKVKTSDLNIGDSRSLSYFLQDVNTEVTHLYRTINRQNSELLESE